MDKLLVPLKKLLLKKKTICRRGIVFYIRKEGISLWDAVRATNIFHLLKEKTDIFFKKTSHN